MTMHRPVLGLVLGSFAIILLGGCENTVEPFAGKSAFSMYGALAVHKQRQFVRVKRLRRPVLSDTGRPLNADVTLTNLKTGRTTRLHDSIITYEGTPTHNYTARVRIMPNSRYRLTVEGAQGKRTEATTRTPKKNKAVIVPSGHTPGAPLDTVKINADALHCRTRFTVLLRDIIFPYRTSVGVQFEGEQFWIPQEDRIVTLPNGQKGFKFTLTRLLSRLEDESPDDFGTCRYLENRCQQLTNGRIRITYLALGPDWFGNKPPPDAPGFDPTTSGPIENGLGFFGSYYRDTLAVTIHRGVIDRGPDACRRFSRPQRTDGTAKYPAMRDEGRQFHARAPLFPPRAQRGHMGHPHRNRQF